VALKKRPKIRKIIIEIDPDKRLRSDGVSRFGLWLREKLKNSRLEQRDLARALGVSESTVSKLMRGGRRWGVEEIYRASKLLGVSLEAFFRAMGFR
jgi:plasmid maintenance system antidote protein VapI